MEDFVSIDIFSFVFMSVEGFNEITSMSTKYKRFKRFNPCH